MKKITFLLLFALLTIFTSCGQPDKDKYVLIETEYGNMKIKLYAETPEHQANFIKLAEQGFYNGQIFHRVIHGFMIQGGDPDSKNAQPGALVGTGGDQSFTLPAEFNNRFYHKRGALSAARKGDQVNPEKRSSGSQFFIVQGTPLTKAEIEDIQKSKNLQRGQGIFFRLVNENKEKIAQLRAAGKAEELNALAAELQKKAEEESKQGTDYIFSPEQIEAYTTIGGCPALDNEYTVFGEVTEGLDVIDKIAAQMTDQNDRPLKDIKFKVTVLN